MILETSSTESLNPGMQGVRTTTESCGDAFTNLLRLLMIEVLSTPVNFLSLAASTHFMSKKIVLEGSAASLNTSQSTWPQVSMVVVVPPSQASHAQKRERELAFAGAVHRRWARSSRRPNVRKRLRQLPPPPHHIADTSERSEDMQRFAGALLGTGKTHVAQLAVNFDLAIFRRSNRARRATLDAETTLADPNTLMCIQGQFRLNALRFRIAAPLATQWTAIQKHHGTNARPGQRIPLNVEHVPVLPWMVDLHLHP